MKIRISLFALAIAILTFGVTYGQTQKGHVRSIASPETRTGERLPGVKITIAGIHQDVVSDENGEFSFDIPKGQNTFRLVHIYLDGYELQEKSILENDIKISSVPFEIVMISLAEKENLWNRFYSQFEKKYFEDSAKIASMAENGQIGNDKCAERMLELEKRYCEMQRLIPTMFGFYLHLGNRSKGTVDSTICSFIENGEFERADSTIAAIIAKSERKKDTLRKLILQNELKMNELKLSKLKNDSILAIGYNSKITYYISIYKKDSAAFYFEKLAALDTSNIRRLINTGKFLEEEIGQHEKARSYFNLALRQSIVKYGEDNPYTVTCYNNIGSICKSEGDFEGALEWYNKALAVQKRIFEENDNEIRKEYLLISNTYKQMGNAGKYIDNRDNRDKTNTSHE